MLWVLIAQDKNGGQKWVPEFYRTREEAEAALKGGNGEGEIYRVELAAPLSPDQWDCRCGYQNTGPICTKCGQLRQGQRR